jgi:hypothetical protein
MHFELSQGKRFYGRIFYDSQTNPVMRIYLTDKSEVVLETPEYVSRHETLELALDEFALHTVEAGLYNEVFDGTERLAGLRAIRRYRK